jgi:hypothetical protein
MFLRTITCPQHDPLVRTKTKVAATMGRPNGTNAEHPSTFLRSHVKEPVLTARKRAVLLACNQPVGRKGVGTCSGHVEHMHSHTH